MVWKQDEEGWLFPEFTSGGGWQTNKKKNHILGIECVNLLAMKKNGLIKIVFRLHTL